MSIEYHGWVALATSHDDWCDGDFATSVHRVRELLLTIRSENGHDPVVPEQSLLPQIVYLNGGGAESLVPVLRVLQDIGNAFDRAYGEVVVFDDKGNQNRRWDFSGAIRYRLVEGKLGRDYSV